ncbi:MAG: isoprenylcysteine carboxylmethyltransferase family protein [Marinoscillum sp.]|uniref:NnrU family protein n=1 Tax=Marinoscillum sp. TaxID=2024838 RepID=UPI0032F2D7BD
MDYLIIGGSWALYFALHSFLASGRVKRSVQSSAPVIARGYRFFYSLISTVGLLWLIYLMAITPSASLFDPPGYLRYIAMILASWGVILVVTSFRHLSGWAFLGLKKEENKGLIRKGTHAYVRHPISSGIILIVSGMALYTSTDIVVLSSACILVYLPVGIYFEEQKLIEEFGDAYRIYQAEVPAIFPKIF